MKVQLETITNQEHISTYERRDLVLIGSNIPHLNFDYGVQEEYQKVVVHLNKDFVEQHFSHARELTSIKDMFDTSKKCIAFSGDLVPTIGKRLFGLAELTPFQQYQHLVETLLMLSQINSRELLHEKPYLTKFSEKEQRRMQLIHAFIDKNYHRKIEIEELSKLCFITKEAFCRYFKKTTTYTFIEFLNRYRVSQSKLYLMAGESVSDAMGGCRG